jgi:hypothetical protein
VLPGAEGPQPSAGEVVAYRMVPVIQVSGGGTTSKRRLD